MRAIKFISLLMLILFGLNLPASAKIVLKSELSKPSKEGYFSLSWEGNISPDVFLEMSPSADFKHIERDYPLTRNGKITISGYGDGEFYFRLRNRQSGEVSNSVTVRVEHWSLERATLFFYVGLALFIFLISVLFFSARKNKSN